MVWLWTGNTRVNSIALSDNEIDGQIQVFTGVYFYDNVRNIAQLIEWNGANLAVDFLTGWYWTGNTTINSVAVGNVDSDSLQEVITGGAFFDGTRYNSQLTVWGMK